MAVANSLLVTPSKPLILGVVTCDLLFRRWPELEIDRIAREVTTNLTVTDDEGYVNIAELCQLIGFINQGRLPSAQPFASSFRWFNSHNKGDYSLKIKRVRHTVL
jgi:hypothetical protein